MAEKSCHAFGSTTQVRLIQVLGGSGGLMLVRAELNEIIDGDRGMLKGIEACLERQCLVSAVTLIFTMIDTLAALTRPLSQESTTGKIFQDWIKHYAHIPTSKPYTARDLWGSRCGVLHLYSPDSDLSRKGLVKPIYYMWAAGPPVDVARTLPSDAIIVTVEELYEMSVLAARQFQNAVQKDNRLEDGVETNLKDLFCYRPFQTT